MEHASVRYLCHDHRSLHRVASVAVMIILSGGLSLRLAAKEKDAASTTAASFPAGRIIDLTHPFDEKTVYWPTEGPFEFKIVSDGRTKAGYYYAANRFAAAEHGGTHIDAPRHFSDQGETVDAIPLERLIGEGILIDVAEKCAKNPDYQIGVNDLRAWEVRHRRQLVDVIVLLRTGYGKRWPDRRSYLGTEERGPDAVSKLHFPGLHPDAARWLVEHRQIKAIGLDTASIDTGQSRTFGSHVMLFKHNVPVFENVAHLDDLPETGFQLVALPMKISGGSGGPLRIVAIVPGEKSP